MNYFLNKVKCIVFFGYFAEWFCKYSQLHRKTKKQEDTTALFLQPRYEKEEQDI